MIRTYNIEIIALYLNCYTLFNQKKKALILVQTFILHDDKYMLEMSDRPKTFSAEYSAETNI
jgi:hypothetical protein